MKKVLRCVEPSLRSYLGDAFCFSIIEDFAFSKGWIYDKYINIQYTPNDRHIKYEDYDYYDFVAGEGVFIKSFTQIPIQECNQEFICNIIEDMVNLGEYFFALFDENIITNYLYNEDKKVTFEHGCFIYGYDSSKKVFFMEGYVKGEKWEKYEIPYSVFYKALSYCPEKGEIAFIGYQVKKDYDWSFEYNRMYSSLQKYLNKSKYKNLSAIRCFLEDMCITRKIHYPSAYCLLEHKKLMKKRILFLISKGYLTIKKDVHQPIDDINIGYEKILMLVIKYNISGNEKILTQIYEIGIRMIEKEYKYLKYILMNLPEC